VGRVGRCEHPGFPPALLRAWSSSECYKNDGCPLRDPARPRTAVTVKFLYILPGLGRLFRSKVHGFSTFNYSFTVRTRRRMTMAQIYGLDQEFLRGRYIFSRYTGGRFQTTQKSAQAFSSLLQHAGKAALIRDLLGKKPTSFLRPLLNTGRDFSYRPATKTGDY